MRQRNYLQQTRTYEICIDNCHKESERRAAYTEQSTANFNNFANYYQEYHQEDCKITFGDKVENNSIIVNKTI